MGYLVDVNNLCYELYNVMRNNFGGDVDKKNFNSKFKKAKAQILEGIEDTINQNKETMREEFNL